MNNCDVDSTTKISRIIDTTISLQKQDDCLIIMSDDIPLSVLNVTSRYIYDNCEGKTVEEISNMLFEECIDNCSLNKQNVLNDCIEAIGIMSEIGLVKCEI